MEYTNENKCNTKHIQKTFQKDPLHGFFLVHPYLNLKSSFLWSYHTALKKVKRAYLKEESVEHPIHLFSHLFFHDLSKIIVLEFLRYNRFSEGLIEYDSIREDDFMEEDMFDIKLDAEEKENEKGNIGVLHYIHLQNQEDSLSSFAGFYSSTSAHSNEADKEEESTSESESESKDEPSSELSESDKTDALTIPFQSNHLFRSPYLMFVSFIPHKKETFLAIEGLKEKIITREQSDSLKNNFNGNIGGYLLTFQNILKASFQNMDIAIMGGMDKDLQNDINLNIGVSFDMLMKPNEMVEALWEIKP